MPICVVRLTRGDYGEPCANPSGKATFESCHVGVAQFLERHSRERTIRSTVTKRYSALGEWRLMLHRGSISIAT